MTNNISNLSRSKLSEYSIQLVLTLLKEQGFHVSKIIEGRLKTKYKITQTCNIKITCYRYNSKSNGNYAYFLKKDYDVKTEEYLFFVLYIERVPHILKIPSHVFINPAPNTAFKNRDYIGKKSLPEYGIIMNKNNLDELLIY